MNKILFVLALFAIVPSCSFTSCNNSCTKSNNDTVVCCEKILSEFPPYEKHEFFVEIKKDTSVYSFIFFKSATGKTRMSINFMVRWKMFNFLSAITNNANDTTAGGGILEEPKREFHTPSYKGMLKEMELCMNEASKIYDLGRFKSINCQLLHLGDIAVLSNYEAAPRPHTDFYKDYENVKKALNNTSFKKDLNHILNQYGVEVKELSLQESMGYIDKKAFLSSQNITKGLKVPDYFFDAEVVIELGKIIK